MKLSVCIPVYDFDVRQLVFDLKKQIEPYSADAEIILIDDASQEKFRNLNQELSDHVNHFIVLEENIGRSRIRNLFLEYADGDFLLFLDCDVQIDSPQFISNYLKIENENPETDVFYGNFKIDQRFKRTFRNRYSEKREIFHEERSSDFSLLKTVNFMIRKSLFSQFKFDEKLLHYGYEDYVFAKVLQANEATFSAFQNPIIHVDNSSASEFLLKSQTAIETLVSLLNDPNRRYVQDVKLVKWALKIKKLHAEKIFLVSYKMISKKIFSNLYSDDPKIFFFDLFKLNELLKRL
ncbi:hypothetical protein ASG01_05290 [Chryseobacterium sp. Leaf180]|uniref:glycosyltransferase family 2 protein n=1 Tax=Chryseobacterium sp. Leaf180 TaxID=1736289 RepID=UPI0006FF4DC8|nr:glycosyltransferase [Chryseobacterium sp. Leaf180]KQR95263.1 hypothetical protein ASG01_05290 [Chryseobacterium sp. Leaf180]